MDNQGGADAVDRLAAEVERVANRLRTLGATRLARPLPPYASVADAGRTLAAELAAAAQAVEAGGASGPAPGPAPRPLPVLPDTAVGDQVAVTGHDLVAAVAAAGVATAVVSPDGTRTTAGAIAAVLAARTREIKLAVD